MKLILTRTLADLRPVLLDPNCSGPDVVYTVMTDFDPSGVWKNKTEIIAGLLGREFPKTFGHYHSAHVDEIYAEVSGEGILLLQKKVVRNGVWIHNEVSEVLLVKVSHGDRVTIRPEYGHSWSNTGQRPLITFDNWSIKHQDSDYQFIRDLHGMAYYLTKVGEEIIPVPNPNYQNLFQPQFLTAEEFKRKSSG